MSKTPVHLDLSEDEIDERVIRSLRKMRKVSERQTLEILEETRRSCASLWIENLVVGVLVIGAIAAATLTLATILEVVRW